VHNFVGANQSLNPIVIPISALSPRLNLCPTHSNQLTPKPIIGMATGMGNSYSLPAPHVENALKHSLEPLGTLFDNYSCV